MIFHALFCTFSSDSCHEGRIRRIPMQDGKDEFGKKVSCVHVLVSRCREFMCLESTKNVQTLARIFEDGTDVLLLG